MATAIDPSVGGLPLPGAPSPARGRVVSRARGVRPAVLLASLFIIFILIAAIAPSLLTKGDPLQVNLAHSLQSPSLEFPFGTDQSGRSVYTRVIYGARESILIGLGATAVALGIAALLGVAAGLGQLLVNAVTNQDLPVVVGITMLVALIYVVVNLVVDLLYVLVDPRLRTSTEVA